MSNDKGSGSGSKSIVDRVLDHKVTVPVNVTPGTAHPVVVPVETSLREVFTGKKGSS
jgi:hypothetical protein